MIAADLKPLYEVELIKKGNAHFYGVDGKRLPGVTGILSVISKPALIHWAKKEALASVSRELLAFGANPVTLEPDVVAGILKRASEKPREISTAACDYGTTAHKYFDQIVKGEPLGDVPKEIENSVLGFWDWVKAHGIQFVAGDTRVANLEDGYGGSFDALAIKDGQLIVIDYKTSKDIYPEYALQAGGAYARATEKTFGVKVGGALIVRFGKNTPDYDQKFVKDLDLAYKGFLAAKTLQEVLRQELYQ